MSIRPKQHTRIGEKEDGNSSHMEKSNFFR